jgi:D-alanyl-D-alanine carboxypeptidase
MKKSLGLLGAFLGLLVLIGLCSCGQSQTSAVFSDDFKVRVTAAFNASVSKNGFPGATLGVMRASDGATLCLAAGLAEANDPTIADQRTWTAKSALTTGTHFRIASVSKTFTATLILILVDEGAIALTDTIDHYFPGLTPNSATIEVQHLLTMSSGLYDHEFYPPLGDYLLNGSLTQYFTPETLVGYSLTYGSGEVRFAPGQYGDYCNTNYTILAMIAQQATGKPYDQLIREKIVTPLGLTGTFAPASTEVDIPAPVAHGYQPPSSESAWRDYSVQNMSWDLGAGTIISPRRPT